ncbi:MAG: O-antigen ligase family protein [Patescibacteria group bacterium]
MNFPRLIRFFLFAAAFTPLILFPFLPFPYTASKSFALKIFVGLALIGYLAAALRGRPDGRLALPRSFLFKISGLFFLAFGLNTIFAVNRYHAFWGNMERGEGLFFFIFLAIFFLLSLLFFDREAWLKFFKLSLGVGFIVIFYAWLQYLGIESFPFALATTWRPGSFADNPAFLASYLILLLVPVAAVFARAPRSSFWRSAAPITGILIVLTIFLTNTRGAILGLAAGLFFALFVLSLKSKRHRRLTTGVLGLILVFLTGFWFTRGAGPWQKVPGFNRLARLSLDDHSIKPRIIALDVSWEALKAKPLLGWGIENYNVAYNAHYNPDFEAYEESWFDRAHNKLAEVAVTQGVVGLVIYLGLFAALFYELFRVRDGDKKEPSWFSPAAGAVFAAYFVQNLFLFDSPLSHLYFIAGLGFVLREKSADQAGGAGSARKGPTVLPGFLAGISSLVLIYFLYVYIFVPLKQAAIYSVAVKTEIGSVIVKASPRFLEPYNYLQPSLRFQFLQLANRGPNLRNPEFDPLTTRAITSMEEVVTKEPDYEPRYRLILAEVYNERGKDQPELFQKSEAHLRQAMKISPRRQDSYYLLAFALAAQEKFAEAVELMREAVKLNPGVAKAHFNLGLGLALSSRENWPESLREIDTAFQIGFLNPTVGATDAANIAVIYERMIAAYILERNGQGVIELAKRFKRLDGSKYAADMDTIIELVRRGEWDVLRQTVIGE